MNLSALVGHLITQLTRSGSRHGIAPRIIDVGPRAVLASEILTLSTVDNVDSSPI